MDDVNTLHAHTSIKKIRGACKVLCMTQIRKACKYASDASWEAYKYASSVVFRDTKRSEKLKFYHKLEPRIHVIQLTDLIRVSKTLPQMQVEARFLEGKEEIYSVDILTRAFLFVRPD